MSTDSARMRRWGAGWLLLSWIAYWVILAAVKLGPALLVARRLTALPNGHGNISLGFANSVLKLTMLEDGRTVWDGTTTLGVLALWLVVPPLLLWLLWLAQHARAREERNESLEQTALLGEPAPRAVAERRERERDRQP